MSRAQRAIVATLEQACCLTHPVVLRRPWLWAFHHCPLGRLALKLEERWAES